jgi:hypothetical protein
MRDPRFAVAHAWEVHDDSTAEQLEHARALGREVGAGTVDVARLRQVQDALRGASFVRQRAFRDEFVATARATPARQGAWSGAIEREFVAARDALPSDLLSSVDGARVLDYATRQWRAELDPFSVWGRNTHHIALRGADVVGWGILLILVQPRAGLRALDTLPCPDLMEMVLFSSLHEDRELVEELITAAPLVVDEAGCWVPERSVAALLVVELIIEHASALREAIAGFARGLKDGEDKTKAKRALRGAEAGELPRWLRRAFELVSHRPDGRPIAIRYLGHLSRQTLTEARPERSPSSPWPAYEKGLAALAVVLARGGGAVERIREAWRDAERLAAEKAVREPPRSRVGGRTLPRNGEGGSEGARTLHADGMSLLVGAARVLGMRAAPGGEIEPLWAWFEELLEGRDPGMEYLFYGGGLTRELQRIGSLVSSLGMPGGRVVRAYERLEPQRRRALYGARYGDRKGDVPSLVLLQVGLNVAAAWNERAKGGAEVDSARELFFWLHEAACRLWLTATNDVEDRRRQLVLTSFAFMPVLFEGSLGEALKRTLPRLAVDPRTFGEACAFLEINGVEAEALPRLVAEAGFDLVAALRDAHHLAALAGEKQAFPEHLQELANLLGVDLELAIASSEDEEGEQARRARGAFLQSVQWASALLERLEADGCRHPRVMRLDGRGTTWAVQATLPQALRDRFGLAPDIRVLAVKGQARGHDLRLASSEPEGRDNIDPDLLVVASDQPELPTRIVRLAGPWGQRVPWAISGDRFDPLAEQLERYLPTFDLFERRDPVRGRAFFGRHTEIDAIVARLLRGQAVGAFGLRKVGKSSLLQAVFEALDPAGAARAWFGSRSGLFPGVHPEAFVVWLDVQGLALRTRDDLAEQLCDDLRERLGLTGLPEEAEHEPPLWFGDDGSKGPKVPTGDRTNSAPLNELRRLIESAVNREVATPVCFIFDEYDLLFEGYSGEPAVAGVEQIFALLRSLAQATGRVSLALIGRDPVFVERPLLNGFSNPLLGWVEPMPVGPFPPEEARELLTRVGRRVGVTITNALFGQAYRSTGGHPMLLRQYGSAAYEASREGRLTPRPLDGGADLERVTQLFLRRDAVDTICGEIRVLLATRFPGSLALLEEAASSEREEGIPAALGRHGGPGGREAKVLLDFGLLRERLGAYWVPLVYRDYFGEPAPKSAALRRSQPGGE